MHLTLGRPSEMSHQIWDSLMGYIAHQGEKGFKSSLVEIRHVPPRWRAKIKLNDVVVRIYYSPTKQRWCRS